MTQFEREMAEGRFWAKTKGFRQRLDFTLAGIDAMLASAPRAYVSLSFGKQSTVLAHMVWCAAPATEMHFLASEETWELYDYAKVIADVQARWPIALHIHQTRRFTGAASWEASRGAGDRDLQNMCQRDEWDGWFWGLTKEESPMRAFTLLSAYRQETPHPTIFRYADGKLRCCPLMHWGIRDIAAYVSMHDIPLLNIYKKFGLEQRTTARITKKMLRNQGMSMCRMTNSAGFRRLVDRFPEINVQ